MRDQDIGQRRRNQELRVLPPFANQPVEIAGGRRQLVFQVKSDLPRSQGQFEDAVDTPFMIEANPKLLKPAQMDIDTRLQGPTLSVEDLLELTEGDVLTFDYPVDRPINTLVNGKLKLLGQVVNSGRKKAFLVHKHFHPTD